MKQLYRKIMPYILACEILISSLFSCSITVYAADFMPRDIIQAVEYGIETNDWDPFWNFLNETKDGLAYLFSQMGAIVTANFQQWVDNNKALESLAEKVPVPARKEENNIVFTKEFMSQLKALLDEYIKTEQTKEENGGYIVVPTMDMTTIPPQWFLDSGNYKTFRNLMAENGLLMVTPKNDWGTIGAYFLFGDPFYDHSEKKKTDIVLVADKDSLERYRADPSLPLTANFYDANRWCSATVYRYTFRDSDVHQSWNEGPGIASTNTYAYYVKNCFLNATTDNVKESNRFLCSLTGERVRVFVSEIAAQNYSVGQREVYFTENYYNYVPEDLSVSIDDLQKSVDDLKDVLDQLLGQIGDNTSEKEIEELLKKILEAIQNQPGGDGPGDGDVNVDIDLSSTNTLLSKILAKITQISDQISASAGQTMTDVVESINNLGEMLKKYLIAITGDLDDIKGKLEQMTEEEFNEKTDSFLNETTASFSEIAEVAKGKFPFSIPNDMRTLLEKLSLPPPSPETAALYSAGTAGAVPYSGDHGGGGASRPPGGISSIEQGSGGGSFGISENGAPVIRCPIVLKRLGIDYAIKIDLSEFDKVAALSRALLTFLFIYGLYNLTFKVIGLWGDLTE